MAWWLVAVGAVVFAVVVARQLRPGRPAVPPDDPVRRGAGGVWSVAGLSFGPLVLAGLAALATPVLPLVHNRRDAVWLLAGVGAGLLAFAGYGLLDSEHHGGWRRVVWSATQGVLGTVAIFAAGAGAFLLGRLEAQSPLAVMVAVGVLGATGFAVAAAGIPGRHPGVDTGLGPETVPFLGLFGVLAVPIFSDRTEFLATKVDGWPGVAVFVAVLVVLGLTMGELQKAGGYLATRRLPGRTRSARALVIRCAVLVAAAIALAAVFRR